MRVRAAALVCLLAGSVALVGCGAGTGSGGGDGAASCVGPYLDDQPAGGRFGAPPPTVAPGDSLEVHGHWYTDTCNDTGQDDPVTPLPDVRLTVTFPGGGTAELGPFTPAGRDLGFTATVEVPEDARPGAVVVRDDRDPGATYRFRVGRAGAVLPEVVAWDGEGVAPPLTLVLDGRRVDLDPWTACYGNGCYDGAARPPYEDVGARDAVPFSFPEPDWTFEATFRSGEYDACPRVVTVPVRRTSGRTFEIAPAGPAGTWLVDVFGRGPDGGDVITTFAWTTTTAGRLPEAATGSAGVLADLDRRLTSYGVEVYVQDLAERPRRAAATVEVTSSEGRSVTLTPRWEKDCYTWGSLTFTAPDTEGLRATGLGAGPFAYDVALTLDGTTYHGVGTWPDDETEDIAPHVPLTWTPALPVYRG
jgi:hypothetical protein